LNKQEIISAQTGGARTIIPNRADSKCQQQTYDLTAAGGTFSLVGTAAGGTFSLVGTAASVFLEALVSICMQGRFNLLISITCC